MLDARLKYPFRKLFCSNTVLVFGVIVSAIVSISVDRFFEQKKIDKNLTHMENVVRDIELAFDQYSHPLQGCVGLYHSHDFNVSASKYRSYAVPRGLFQNFKGALGFGFIRKVNKADLSTYLKKNRELRKDFNLRRIGDVQPERDDVYVIEVVEPVEVNAKAVGLVVSDELHRYQAAFQSMRTGRPAITKSIQLVQAQKNEPGFLYFLPIYKTQRPPETESERVKQLVGWAYAPILASELGRFVLSRNQFAPPFEIVELGAQDSKLKLFSQLNFKNLDQSQMWIKKMNVVGQDWEIRANIKTSTIWTVDSLWSMLLFLLLSSLSFIVSNYLSSLKKEFKMKDHAIRVTQKAVDDATHELQEKSDFLKTIINGLPALVGYWDRDLKNRLSNSKHSDYFHLSPEQMYGQSMTQLFPKEIYLKLVPYIEDVLKGVPQEFEHVIEDSMGEKRTMRTSFFPDFKKNEVIGFIVILLDISDIRELEKENQEKQAQLYSRSKLSMLGEMAAGIAHEINNPLTIINVKILNLKSQLSKSDNLTLDREKIFQNIDIISNTVHRISAIIKGLRTFSRDSDQDPYENCLVENIIEQTLSLTKERVNKRSIDIRVNYMQSGLTLSCNQVQIEQVLMNLISNSIDAIEDLNEKWINIHVSLVRDRVHIRFVDSGCGIAPAVVDKIMQPFFTTKAVGKGTGIGLSISKGILENHGGHLTYELFDGHTSFVMNLPEACSMSQENKAS